MGMEEKNLVEGAGAIASGNPAAMGSAILNTLKRVESHHEAELELARKIEERYQARSSGRDTWHSIGYRYVAADGKRGIEIANGINISHLFISTISPDSVNGVFYVAFEGYMQIDPATNIPNPGTWDYAGKIGGESLMFPLPLGITNVQIFSNIDHDGTIYVARSKEALPG